MSAPALGTAGRLCATCRYFARAESECRFTAPSPVGWPHAPADAWCGEWTAARTQEQPCEAAAVRRALLDAQGPADGLHPRLPERAA